MEDRILKIKESILNLKDKKNKIYFFVQDTKGNAKASIRYIYQIANTLLKEGYNPIILHEKPDYFGVSSWLGEQYSKIPHQSVEGQNLQIAPEDFIIVPEIFGYVMAQLTNIKCTKIVLSQSYDQIFETLQPGQIWSQFGFTKCITTSEIQKKYISQFMRNVPTDIIEPVISDVFEKSKYPAKPIIAISSATPDDVNKLDTVPTLGQTAWSRQIAYDADWVLALGRGTNSDIIECVFRKNRNGFMGEFFVQADFDKGWYKYKDMEDK
jgi:hypothetical protein